MHTLVRDILDEIFSDIKIKRTVTLHVNFSIANINSR